MSKTVMFQTIQFSTSTQFCSIWPIDMTLSGATSSAQSGPGSDGSPHSPKLQHDLRLTIILFCVISRTLVGGVLPLRSDAVCVFYSPNRLGHNIGLFSPNISRQIYSKP